MSEFTQHQKERIKQLEVLFNGILKGENLVHLVRENQNVIDNCIPADVVYLVDKLVIQEIPIEQLKKGINKLHNLLHKTISEYVYHQPAKESYLGCLVENNRLLDEKLKEIRPQIREINKQPDNVKLRNSIKTRFEEIENLFVEKEDQLCQPRFFYLPFNYKGQYHFWSE